MLDINLFKIVIFELILRKVSMFNFGITVLKIDFKKTILEASVMNVVLFLMCRFFDITM